MMESRFDMNDFERSLKDQVDRFFLIPSERVWKSIYNDLHPGSKWPSLTVGLVLVISLFWIGNSHRNTVVENVPVKIEKDNPPKTTASLYKTNQQSQDQPGIPQSVSQVAETGNTTSIPLTSSVLSNEDPGAELVTAPSSGIDNMQQPLIMQPIINIPEYTVGIHLSTYPKSLMGMPVLSEVKTRKAEPLIAITREKESIKIIAGGENEFSIESNSKTRTTDTKITDNQPGPNKVSATQATASSAKKKTKKHKAEWTFFATPERSNVHFEGKNLNQSPSGIVTSPYSTHDMTTRSRYGFQVGTDVNYKLNKTVELTSGFHLNYSGYDIMAELAHPSLATVTFRNSKGELFTKNYIAMYGNEGNGSLKITNYNMQFAIPVGLQWILFEKDNIKVSVVSTVEPFLVLGSKAYILSGDGKKFVNDPDLMRKINLNGNFSSVITFSSHNVDWKIGPSIRYQFLSTYHNIYPVREHLINYGIRLGISKPH